MCGIVGYLGNNQATPVLLDGLKRLEYRGYDSSGMVILNGGKAECLKAVGKIKELEKKMVDKKMDGFIGIAHTRWATHGCPSEMNAHPHSDESGNVWVVHNGIIENYQALKQELISRGYKFRSETDTEVIAHLVSDLYKGDITKAVQRALRLIKGAYGLVVMHREEPEKLVVARHGSPLVVGLGDEESIIASDVTAILRYTKQVIYLDDGEMAEIKKDGFRIFDGQSNEINKETQEIEWDLEKIEKGGYPHFMLKEIHEQPDTILDSIRGRTLPKVGKAKLGGLEIVKDDLRGLERIIIAACGTACHAGLVGEYMMEEYAGIQTEVEYASEFRYRKPIVDEKTAILAISQSGETADTLAAIKEGREKGALTLGIVNAVGSTIARETDAGVYNHIGPEISVASTKAFTSQVAIMALFTVLLGRQRGVSLTMGARIINELEVLPEKIKTVIKLDKDIEKIAKKYCKFENFAFLGRKYNMPVALEGALKLKELSYIHAEGFPSGEMKHGSIALIDRNFPCFFIAPLDSVYEKNLSNIEEIRSRSGRIIAITTAGNTKLKNLVDDVIYIPKTLEMLTPILSVIPLQFFAYYCAVMRDKDVDKPRNLAKSVTVE